jgi:hypothetical protein
MLIKGRMVNGYRNYVSSYQHKLCAKHDSIMYVVNKDNHWSLMIVFITPPAFTMVRIINHQDQSEAAGQAILQHLREMYTRDPPLPTRRTEAHNGITTKVQAAQI